MDITISQFPPNPTDGQTVASEFGEIFQYDAESDSWIDTGVQISTSLVSDTQNGLISPQIYNLINRIQQLEKDGVSFQYNKIWTGSMKKLPYFYYFHSTDKTISFRYYVDNTKQKRLQIEVNRQRLLNKIMSQSCAGSVGAKGQKGLTGFPGIAANPETPHSAFKVTSDTFTVRNTIVNTPIDTDISLRIISGTTILIEVLIPISGSGGVTYNSKIQGLVVNVNQSNISFTNSQISGSVVLARGTFNNWSNLIYKVRQKGPTGPAGQDGDSFITISNIITNNDINYSEFISALYKSTYSDDMFYTMAKAPISGVYSSSLSMSALPIGSYPVSLEISNNTDLQICYYAPSGVPNSNPAISTGAGACCVPKAPNITLPSWYPYAACILNDFTSIVQMEWWKDIPQPAINACFDIPVPLNILVDAEGSDIEANGNCVDNFWLCTNLGDCCPIVPPNPPPPPVNLELET